MDLIILGAPGAGKGTQTERFARAHRVPRISTGDILREAVASGTALGKSCEGAVNGGALVRDEVITEVVRKRLACADASGGFVLDGFPRTIPQARALDDILEGREPLCIVELAVPEDALIARLTRRVVCGDCGRTTAARQIRQRCEVCDGPLVQRSDDSDGVIAGRLAVYGVQIEALRAYYCRRPQFHIVNGNQGPDRVADDIAAALSSSARR